eukprot:jgi/Mesvir1/1711/Mv21167-RA.1
MITLSSSQVTLYQIFAAPGIGAHVMGFLSIPERVQVRRTCRAFLSAVDQTLQGLTELFGEDVASSEWRPGTQGLRWLVIKCPNLRTLSVASREDHEEPWRERDRFSLTWPTVELQYIQPRVVSLGDIARTCQGLTYLNVAGCSEDVTGAGIMAIARSCRGLEALDVSDCHVGDAAIQAVAESCRGLRRLAASCMWSVTDASLVSLGQHCPQLEALDVDFAGVTDEGVIAIAGGCPCLRRLVVACRVTDAAISQVAEHCRELEHLGVEACKSVTDASIKTIAANCPRLRRLDVPNTGITDNSISVLAGKCTELRRLNVAETGVSDAGISVVAAHCAQLEYLDVSECDKVTDDSITQVGRRCAHLQALLIGSCMKVGDAGIGMVARNCAGLRKLVIRMSGYTDAGIKAIARHCGELEYLDMAHGGRDGCSLVALAKGCRQLEYLDISMLNAVSERSFAAIGRYCTGLRVLRARYQRSKETLWALIEKVGPALEVLDLSNSCVTDKAIGWMAVCCPQLQVLILDNCHVRNKGVRMIAKAFTDLRHLNVLECDLTDDSISLLPDDCDVMWSDRDA